MVKHAQIVGIDGTEIYISDGGCLGSPLSRFVFAETVKEARERWNKKYSDAYLSESQLEVLARDSSQRRIVDFKFIEDGE